MLSHTARHFWWAQQLLNEAWQETVMFFSLTFFFFLPIHELLCFELVLRAILFGGTTRNDKKNSPLFWKSKVPPTTFKSKLWSRRLVNTLFATQSEKKIWKGRSNQKAELSVCLIFVHWLHLLPLLTKTDNMHFLPGLFKIISCVLYTHTEWKERASPFYITFFFPCRLCPSVAYSLLHQKHFAWGLYFLMCCNGFGTPTVCQEI